jgi:hypothetical protein
MAICHRKNSLFFRSLRGARVGDIYMALIYRGTTHAVRPTRHDPRGTTHAARPTPHEPPRRQRVPAPASVSSPDSLFTHPRRKDTASARVRALRSAANQSNLCDGIRGRACPREARHHRGCRGRGRPAHRLTDALWSRRHRRASPTDSGAPQPAGQRWRRPPPPLPARPYEAVSPTRGSRATTRWLAPARGPPAAPAREGGSWERRLQQRLGNREASMVGGLPVGRYAKGASPCVVSRTRSEPWRVLR